MYGSSEYWLCRSCGRASSLSEVARPGEIGMSPYFCPGCVVIEGDRTTIPHGTNQLVPWSWARDQNPALPVVPVTGTIYPPVDSSTTH
jgi:hypothetical protein